MSLAPSTETILTPRVLSGALDLDDMKQEYLRSSANERRASSSRAYSQRALARPAFDAHHLAQALFPKQFGARDPSATKQKPYATCRIAAELNGKPSIGPLPRPGEIFNNAGWYGSTKLCLNCGSHYQLIGVCPALKAKQRTFFAEAFSQHEATLFNNHYPEEDAERNENDLKGGNYADLEAEEEKKIETLLS